VDYSYEFYEVNEDPPATLKLDTIFANLLLPCDDINDCKFRVPNLVQKKNWEILKNELVTFLDSSPACPGDGNGDGVVNEQDVYDWFQIATQWGKSSHYDFNFDGYTNFKDLKTIEKNWGPCPKPPSGQ
jgi:hypothetical protein